MYMSKTVSTVTSCYSGLIGQSIVGASVVRFREVLLEESPVKHVNCEGT
jgi:hypothetical protein